VPPAQPSGGVQRALLALNVEALRKDGSAVQLPAPPLALPVVSDEAFTALPADDLVQRRLQELEFARASAETRRLLQEDDIRGAQARLRRLEEHVKTHPELAEKLVRLQELVARDAAMGVKELHIKANVFHTRVVPVQETLYTGDETESADVPSYLRRKAEEGRGRRNRKP
jgi:hypothetical protein